MANVTSEISATGTATLTIDREEKRNALDRATLRELELAFDAAAANSDVRAIVLRGAGDRVFCAGADLREVLGHASMDESRQHFDGVVRVMRAMERAPQPVIARVPGFALAGGFGLAVAADLTIAAESAQFGLPEISLGLLPLMVSVPILRAVGSRKVLLDLVLTGRRVRASEALALYTSIRERHADAHCELEHRNPFELIVATVLSAQSTDVMVNKITPELFKRWPNPKALAAADSQACIGARLTDQCDNFSRITRRSESLIRV